MRKQLWQSQGDGLFHSPARLRRAWLPILAGPACEKPCKGIASASPKFQTPTQVCCRAVEASPTSPAPTATKQVSRPQIASQARERPNLEPGPSPVRRVRIPITTVPAQASVTSVSGRHVVMPSGGYISLMGSAQWTFRPAKSFPWSQKNTAAGTGTNINRNGTSK